MIPAHPYEPTKIGCTLLENETGVPTTTGTSICFEGVEASLSTISTAPMPLARIVSVESLVRQLRVPGEDTLTIENGGAPSMSTIVTVSCGKVKSVSTEIVDDRGEIGADGSDPWSLQPQKPTISAPTTAMFFVVFVIKRFPVTTSLDLQDRAS